MFSISFNLDEEFQIQDAVKKVITARLAQSVHDCSDGGLFVTLMESSFRNNLGFDITTSKAIRNDAFLFGEGQSRVVVSVKMENEIQLVDLLKQSNVTFSKLGFVKGKEVKINDTNYGSVQEFKKAYDTSIEKIMNN